MRISFHGNKARHVRHGTVFRRATSGKARNGEIKTAPEKMNGAALADKARTKLFQNAIRLDEDTPESFHILFVVRGVMLILVVRRRIVELRRLRIDMNLEAKRPQRRHVFGKEIRNGPRIETHDVLPAGTRHDPQSMRDKIEVDFERLIAIWNR